MRARSTAAVTGMLIGAVFMLRHADAAVTDAADRLRSEQFQQLDAEFSRVQEQFERGKISGEDARDAFRAFYSTDKDLAAKYDEWIKRYPNSYVAHLARGIYYKKVGLEARGGKYIEETSQEQIQNMDAALTKAIKDFGDSIPLTRKPFVSYLHMIDIGKSYVSASYTRELYDHAVALDPRSFAARQKFMAALQTKWGGSLEDMQKFLEECRRAKLPYPQFKQLESLVYENEGWERENDGDHAAAEAAYRKAVELDGADCTSCLVSSLTTVLMNERKYAEAIPFLDRYLKSEPGNPWALSTRGLAYFQSGKQAEALADWTVAADAGDAFSQNRLGVLYMTGIPGQLTPDPKKGIEWLRKAAAQGNAEAQHNLPLALSRAAGQTAPAPH